MFIKLEEILIGCREIMSSVICYGSFNKLQEAVYNCRDNISNKMSRYCEPVRGHISRIQMVEITSA